MLCNFSKYKRWIGGLVASLVALAPLGCGGKPPADPTTVGDGTVPIDVDGDPLLLLPSGAFAAGEIDVRAWFAAGRSGAKMVTIADACNPFVDAFGVVASRDIDKITFVAFAGASLEVLGVARGTFDAAKFREAAEKKLLVADGSPVIASRYRNADLYTVANIGFSVLSGKTMLVGTEGGLRRALDRVHDGQTAGKPALNLDGELLAAAQDGSPLAIAYVAAPGSPAALAVGSLPKPAVGELVIDKLVGGRLKAGFAGERTRVQALLATNSAEDATEVREELQRLARMYSIASLVTALPRLAESRIEKGTDTPEMPSGASLVRVDLSVDDGPLARALGAVPLPRR
jgi:hypothetical protein